MAENQQIIDSPRDLVAEHIRRYVATDGREGHLWRKTPTLLLTTRGAHRQPAPDRAHLWS